MASDRTDTGDPSSVVEELDTRIKAPSARESTGQLANKLTPIADRIRGLYARFGIRPYHVYLVHGFWAGPSGRRGDGPLQITSRREITPVPRVRDLGQIAEVLRPTGMTEEGGTIVDQISPRYTEDDLMGKTPDLQDPVDKRTSARGREFWWEIEEVRPTNPKPLIRRFVIAAIPMISRDGVQWVVGLRRQDYDRARDGSTVPRSAF